METFEILHVSTVHQRYDTRVVYRECGGLAKHGYSVTLFVADGQPDQILFDRMKIHSVSKLPKNRLNRFFISGFKMFLAARKHPAKICHFHDPEWIFFAWLLTFFKKSVVYDVHEDYTNVILNRGWIPNFAKPAISKTYKAIENTLCRRFSAIITVTDTLIEKLKRFNPVLVRNYPDLEIYPHPTQLSDSPKYDAIYVGSISIERGINVMIDSAKIVKSIVPEFQLHLAGDIDSSELHALISNSSFITYHGKVKQDELTSLLSLSKVGLAVLQPLPRYMVAFPTKIFEYMASGAYVVASNFPVYKDIIGENSYGECVDPEDSSKIAESILRGLSIHSPRVRQESAIRVQKLFSWQTELNKLESVYRAILSHQQQPQLETPET